MRKVGKVTSTLGLFALLSIVPLVQLQAQSAPHSQTQSQSQLADLVARLLHEAPMIGCRLDNCHILIVNFSATRAAGLSFGFHVANLLAIEIRSQAGQVSIVEPKRLEEYLEKAKIPASELRNEEALRWLGREHQATHVLEVETDGRGALAHIKATLLDMGHGRSHTQQTELPVESGGSLDSMDFVQ